MDAQAVAPPINDTAAASPGAHAKRNKRKKELAKQRKEKAASMTAPELEDVLLKMLSGTSLADTPKTKILKGPSISTVLTELLYEIKPAPGKGLGMFAITTIYKGDEILREEPIFKGSDSWWSKHAMFNILPEEKKRLFMGLHSQCNCGKEKCNETEFMKIWDANSFGVDIFPPLALPVRYKGPFVYLTGSRINHDCNPNTSRGFTSQCQVVFRANKTIEAGEEITTDYLGLGTLPVASRRERYLKQYHFTCTCQACTKNLQLSAKDLLKGAEFTVVSRPGFPLGQHPPELERAFAEVDSWYKMIDVKLNNILNNTLMDLAKTKESNNDDSGMTYITVGQEKLNRMFNYLLKNDKYNLGWKDVTLILHKLQD